MTNERHTPTEYPVDTSQLGKGSVLTATEVETALGTKRVHYLFGIAVMKLSEWIRTRLRDRGLDVVIKQEGGGLRILTDAEAVDYTEGHFNSLKRRLVVTHARALRIDTSNLDDIQRRQLETNVARQGAILLAMRDAEKKQLASARPSVVNLPEASAMQGPATQS